MAEVKLPTSWTLTLDPEEIRLVLRALGGRIDSPDEKRAAKSLGDQITKARTSVAEHLLHTMKKNSDQIVED